MIKELRLGILVFFLVSGFWFLVSDTYAQTESITLTTYYPSPYGEYQRLRLFPSSQPTCDANNVGLMYYDSATNQIRYCDGSLIPPDWNELGGGGPWVWEDTNNRVYLRDNANDNVGIGTTTPVTKLDVVGNAQISGRLGVSGVPPENNKGINVAAPSTINKIGIYGASSPDCFPAPEGTGVAGGACSDATTPRYGVFGSASGPGTNFAVYGTASAGASNWGGYFVGNGYFSGNVGIGTTTPGAKLQVGNNGDGTSALANAWNLLSSRKLKKDIESLRDRDYIDILKKIRQLQIVKYRFLFDEEGRQHIGVIAEDSPREILSKDGKAVSLGDYTTFILAGLKAQQTEIEQLKKEIQSLQEMLKNK